MLGDVVVGPEIRSGWKAMKEGVHSGIAEKENQSYSCLVRQRSNSPSKSFEHVYAPSWK